MNAFMFSVGFLVKQTHIYKNNPSFFLLMWDFAGLFLWTKTSVSSWMHVHFCEKQQAQHAWKGLCQISSCRAEYLYICLKSDAPFDLPEAYADLLWSRSSH